MLDNKAHDARQWYVLFDIGSKSIETSCSSSSAALEGEQSKDTSQNRNLSIVGIGIGESLPLQHTRIVKTCGSYRSSLCTPTMLRYVPHILDGRQSDMVDCFGCAYHKATSVDHNNNVYDIFSILLCVGCSNIKNSGGVLARWFFILLLQY